jgi:pyruvate,water dikinase
LSRRFLLVGSTPRCASRGFATTATGRDFGDFRDTKWMQRAAIRVYGEPVGTLFEVAYLEQMPQADEGPFLKEERKLLETIAERIGSCITHRRLLAAMRTMREPERSRHRGREWMAILDLLRRTDQSLLMRVARKMINHLCWSGVKEAGGLLQEFRCSSRVR